MDHTRTAEDSDDDWGARLDARAAEPGTIALIARQRCVLAAVADAADPGTAARVFPSLADALGNAVRTDIPRDRLDDLVLVADRVRSAGAHLAPRTLSLVPPKVTPARPDRDAIRAMVAETLAPPPPPPPPAGPVPAPTDPPALQGPPPADACAPN